MGREIRRVPPGWEHPKGKVPWSQKPEYLSMMDQTLEEAQAEWDAGKVKWEHGEHPGQREDYTHDEWVGERPQDDDRCYRPAFTSEPTAYQMYQTVSEGTPVSPVFETLQGLADWLVTEGHTREQADAFVQSGWAPSMVFAGGQVASGVDIPDLLNKLNT